MRALLVAACCALVACEARPSSRWDGIPAGPRICSWSRQVGRQPTVGTCIVDRRVYACLDDQERRVVVCAPAPVLPMTLEIE